MAEKQKQDAPYMKFPIVVGITGHRHLADEDRELLKEQVKESLSEIVALCRTERGEDTPVVMLNGFAQSADILCAEVAFEMHIPVYAILPREREKYSESFSDERDRAKLAGYLDLAEKVFLAPDIEQHREWLHTYGGMTEEDYEYRQLGIYIAEHSHILIALWDGAKQETQFGCGTTEVVKFALEHDFLDPEHLFAPGTMNDTAVLWIKARQRKEGEKLQERDIRRRWIVSDLARDEQGDCTDEQFSSVWSRWVLRSTPPAFLKEIVAQTVLYNAQTVPPPAAGGKPQLWKDENELDAYHKSLRYHYIKADTLSYERNQRMYNRFLLLLAVTAALVALTFLIYDDASISFMIFPCTVAIGAVLLFTWIGDKRDYHMNYIRYRALCEAIRIQFYLSLCLREETVVSSVSDLYSWAQKTESVWIAKAIRALGVVNSPNVSAPDLSETLDVWIGDNERPVGQLHYHIGKRASGRKQAARIKKWNSALLIVTLLFYFTIFALETCACILKAKGILWFWELDAFPGVSWRNMGTFLVGTVAVVSLLVSGYWGKLSFDRKTSDSEKMCKFYAAAYERWKGVEEQLDLHPELGQKLVGAFVKEIAREEIVENGIWCSYVSENNLEIDL